MENYLTFPVIRQSFQVLDLCRAATEACHLIHGNCLGQGNVFGNPRHMLSSSQMPYQGILHSTNQSATGRLFARGEERIGSTIPMPMFAGRPSTMNSFLPADIPQNSMVVQQRLSISKLQFDKFPHTFNIFMVEDKIQNPGKLMFRFSLGGYVMDKRSGDGRLSG